MPKNTEKNKIRDAENAAIVKRVADIHGVSERYVNMVRNGERENEAIMNSYMELKESIHEKSALLKAVNTLVPFSSEKSSVNQK